MVDKCDPEKHRKPLELLCLRVLEGAISREDFYREWPCDREKGSFWESLYNDLEDAIQHTPGTWFAGKVDLSQWKQCWEYFVVYLDLLLVRSNKNVRRLQQVRQKALAAKRMPLSEANEFVTRELASREN